MKNIHLIKPNTFVNGLSWYELSCIEALEACIYESLVPNSLYYYLFIKNKNILFDKTSIKPNKKIKRTENKVEYLKKLVDEKRNIILILDEYYHKKQCDYYLLKHHTHPIILKGYDNNERKFLIIDEETSLRDMKMSSGVPFGFIHQLKWMSFEDLEICLNIEEKDIDFGIRYEKDLIMYLEYTTHKNNNIDLNIVKEELLDSINTFLDNFFNKKNEILNYFDKNFNAAPLWYDNHRTVRDHHTYIICVINIIEEVFCKESEFIPIIKENYITLKLMIRKYEQTQKKELKDRIRSKLIELFIFEEKIIKILHDCLLEKKSYLIPLR